MKTKFAKFDLLGRQEKYNEGLLLGLLLGTAIGACAAIFFTPKPGKRLGKKLRKEADEQRRNLGQHWDQVKESAGDAVDQAKDTFKSVANEAESKINKFKN